MLTLGLIQVLFAAGTFLTALGGAVVAAAALWDAIEKGGGKQ